MHFLPVVNKARKPKFDVHLRIYDLNNVPLVSGVSQIKWHLPHSIHGEHRGRTEKCPIANHRVEYHYGKIVPVRIHIDRNDSLEACPIEFEVLQEFGGVGGADEKIVLGKIILNLSEYVEESEAILRDRPSTSGLTSSGGLGTAVLAAAGLEPDHLHHLGHHKLGLGHSRNRSSGSGGGISGIGPPASSAASKASSIGGGDASEGNKHGGAGGGQSGAPEIREGVIRRHLMQESKINSTLKIGILMVQIDGDRNYAAPPLKTAPTFGGIAGLMASDQPDKEDLSTGQAPHSLARSRDASEMQDMYRTALTAAWASPQVPGEMSADACIEDIFGGGTGFSDLSEDQESSSADGGSRTGQASGGNGHRRQRSNRSAHFSAQPVSAAGSLAPPVSFSRDDSGGSPSSADDNTAGTNGSGGATLRPRDVRSFFHRSSAGSSGSEHNNGGGSTVSAGGSRHRRQRSGASDKSARTLVMSSGSHHLGREFVDRTRDRSPARRGANTNEHASPGDPSVGASLNSSTHQAPPRARSASRSRSESLASLATTLGSDRGRDGFRRAREVDEFEVRDDLVAWRVSGKVT